MYDDLQLALEHSSTVDRAAEEVRRAIFAGRLEPGTPLREVGLSAAMGVGRSTVREALGVLVAEGLAVRIPNRGVTVKALGEDDVHDVSRAREALESAGVRRWSQAAESQRQTVRDALADYAALARTPGAREDPATLTAAHLRIHRALVGLTGSERLLAASDVLSSEIRLGLAHLDRTRANLRQQVTEHGHLVDLLEAGRLDDAITELERHLKAAEQSLLEATGHGAASR
jgi:DNA-binding GntR family transcriptional regulator